MKKKIAYNPPAAPSFLQSLSLVFDIWKWRQLLLVSASLHISFIMCHVAVHICFKSICSLFSLLDIRREYLMFVTVANMQLESKWIKMDLIQYRKHFPYSFLDWFKISRMEGEKVCKFHKVFLLIMSTYSYGFST